jgi:hypothetical protein
MKKVSLILKLTIAFGAMGLLIYFNRLDLSMFSNLGEGWPWLVSAVAIWFIGVRRKLLTYLRV